MSSEKEEQKKKASKATASAKATPPAKPPAAAETKPAPEPKPAGSPAAPAKPPAAAAETPPKTATTTTMTTTTTPTPATSAKATPPAKQEPELPAFEKGIAQQITAKFGDSTKILYIKPNRIKVETAPSNIVEVATYLRDSMGFDHAESASGTDYPKENKIEVNYHLGSYTREDLLAQIVVLTTKTNRDDSRVPSLIRVYPSVEYHERETFEMLGVYFEGHPRMERFLLPEDWADIPPLRKEFRIKGR